jgi:glycosyltransferase involved in cell wall biosynthesis
LKVTIIYLGRRGAGPVYSLQIAKALLKYCDVYPVISEQIENVAQWDALGPFKVPTYDSMFQFIVSTLRFTSIRKIIKYVNSINPDVIYYPMLHFWTPLINFFLNKVPKIVTIHDPALHVGERGAILKFLLDLNIKQANRIIILSRSFIDTIKQKGISEEQIAVIPHGEFSYYEKIKEEVISTPYQKRGKILFFGRISPYKGVDVLLKAYALIKQELPEVSLDIVGNGDIEPYRMEMDELQDITLVNRWIKDEEVAKYFSGVDLVVLPYIDASQSGVIPIAYSFKLPVVASNIGGLPEQVDDGVTGYLSEPGNYEELANKCVYLLKRPEMLSNMGEAGFQKAQKEWSWDTIAYQVFLEFQKTLSQWDL